VKYNEHVTITTGDIVIQHHAAQRSAERMNSLLLNCAISCANSSPELSKKNYKLYLCIGLNNLDAFLAVLVVYF
jgi:hypothetical protein